MEGIVQGVGFRPRVHALATSMDLAGFVGNDEAGVFIEHHNNSSGYNDVEVRDSVFDGNGKEGLLAWGANFDATTNMRVIDCQAYDNTGGRPSRVATRNHGTANPAGMRRAGSIPVPPPQT